MIQCRKFKDEEDWLDARKGAISATDVGALVGISDFGKTALDVYMKAVYGKEKKLDENSPLIVRGHLLEPLIRKGFAIDYADTYKVTNPPQKGNWIWWDDGRPYLKGSLDGVLTRRSDRKQGILEIKTTELIEGSRKLEDWREGTLPQTYITQVLTYLAITGWEYAVLRVRIRVSSIDRVTHQKSFKGVEMHDYYFDSEELSEQIEGVKKTVDDFWKEHVIPKKVPDVKVL